MGKACRSSHELARRGKAVLSRTAPKYFASGSGMTLRSSPMDDRNDWMNSAMLEASGPASSTTPFFGCAVAISARVAATSSAATGWNLEGDI
jgi:hypothetical protein